MTHEEARFRISLGLDGELPRMEEDELRAHLSACSECRAYRSRLQLIREELRHGEVGEVPDVAPAVLRAIGYGPRTGRRWVLAVAALLAGLVVGAVLAAPRMTAPPELVATDIPERILRAQTELTSVAARVQVVEHGWHEEVRTRTYEGELAYRAPESLALILDDTTSYPGPGWEPNDLVLVIDDDRWWSRAVPACPPEALPGCIPEPRITSIAGRQPFSDAAPVPLDLIVPVTSFRGAAGVETAPGNIVSGRPTVAISLTAAQAEPILGGFLAVGNWRELHPTDAVQLWLDEETLVPLRFGVTATESWQRELWATRHGYVDQKGAPLLEVRLEEVAFNSGVSDDRFAHPPDHVDPRDAGFIDQPWEEVGGPTPQEVPPGLEPHRAGAIRGSGQTVRSWSDGRAYLVLRSTETWTGARLFGDAGPALRRLDLDNGVAYAEPGARRVAIHGDGVDLEIAGSVSEADLLLVAESLDVEGLPVPSDWPEAASSDIAAATGVSGLLVADPPGYQEPAVSIEGETVRLVYLGPGAKSFVLTRSSGEVLSPPLDDDVVGVEVRGTVGRYTPARGELEWLESGAVLSLQSEWLSLAELITIAEGLERP